MELTFNIVVENRQGAHIATCLEMGLVATADDPDDLPGIMDKLITRQVQFALQHENFQDIFHPADADVWQRFREAHTHEKAREIRKTEEQVIGNWAPVALRQTAYALAC